MSRFFTFVAPTGYIVGFVLTFGQVATEQRWACLDSEPSQRSIFDQRCEDVVPAMALATLWPVYWPLRISLTFNGYYER